MANDPKVPHEAFLKANANEGFIVDQLAELLRDLMRAVSSGDPASKSWSIVERITLIAELCARSEAPFSTRMLVGAIKDINDAIPDDPDDRHLIEAARRGTKYLVESSAKDNAAKGRAAKRLDEFEKAIQWSLEARRRR